MYVCMYASTTIFFCYKSTMKHVTQASSHAKYLFHGICLIFQNICFMEYASWDLIIFHSPLGFDIVVYGKVLVGPPFLC